MKKVKSSISTVFGQFSYLNSYVYNSFRKGPYKLTIEPTFCPLSSFPLFIANQGGCIGGTVDMLDFTFFIQFIIAGNHFLSHLRIIFQKVQSPISTVLFVARLEESTALQYDGLS